MGKRRRNGGSVSVDECSPPVSRSDRISVLRGVRRDGRHGSRAADPHRLSDGRRHAARHSGRLAGGARRTSRSPRPRHGDAADRVALRRRRPAGRARERRSDPQHPGSADAGTVRRGARRRPHRPCLRAGSGAARGRGTASARALCRPRRGMGPARPFVLAPLRRREPDRAPRAVRASEQRDSWRRPWSAAGRGAPIRTPD